MFKSAPRSHDRGDQWPQPQQPSGVVSIRAPVS